MDIGFIGLGGMGSRMAKRLSHAGHQVFGWNYDPIVVPDHIKWANSPAEVAEKVDVVQIMVTGPEEVKSVIFGPDGILSTARPGNRIIQSSTINYLATKEIALQLCEKSIHFLDAPISGSTSGIESGNVVILGGGNASDFEDLDWVFRAYAREILVLGQAGVGTAVKLVLNAITISTMAAAAESLNWLATTETDADLGMVADSLKAVGNSLAKRVELIVGDPQPGGFLLRLASKDMGLMESELDGSDVISAVATLCAEAVHSGFGDYELSSIGTFVREKKQITSQK